jgi:hypothetical protein
MKWNPEQKRDVNAAALVAIGSFGLALTGLIEPSLPGEVSFGLAVISSAVLISGGVLYEKGTQNIVQNRLPVEQAVEAESLQIEYEI